MPRRTDLTARDFPRKTVQAAALLRRVAGGRARADLSPAELAVARSLAKRGLVALDPRGVGLTPVGERVHDEWAAEESAERHAEEERERLDAGRAAKSSTDRALDALLAQVRAFADGRGADFDRVELARALLGAIDDPGFDRPDFASLARLRAAAAAEDDRLTRAAKGG